MSDHGTEDVLRLLAQAEDLPADELGDPSATPSTVVYDPGLQAELEEHGPAALQEYGKITVRGAEDATRHSTAVWYALKWGLEYQTLPGGVVILTDRGASDE